MLERLQGQQLILEAQWLPDRATWQALLQVLWLEVPLAFC
ncbi:hypothetical protein EMIT0P294_50317 [Pseudomonas sp. IT-P294]